MPTIAPQFNYSVNELVTVVYNRPKLDAEGAGLRAVLSAGAAQIIHASKLDLLRPPDPEDTLDIADVPGFPLLVLREGTITETQRILSNAIFRWFIYDLMEEGYWRINSIPPLLARAYAAAPLVLASGGVVKNVRVGSLSGATVDTGLGLRVRYVDVSMLVA